MSSPRAPIDHASFPPPNQGLDRRAPREASRPPGLAGREREWAEISKRLDDAKRGHGAIIVLAGEAGIGKSFLATSALAVADQRGFLTGWGRAVEDGWIPALGPWSEAMSGMLGRLTAETQDHVLADIAPAFQPLARGLMIRSPNRPDAHDRADVPADELPRLSVVEEQRRQADALTTMLVALSRLDGGRPLALVLDDLHWADSSSLAVVRAVSRALAHLPIVLIITHRDDVPSDHPLRSVVASLMRDPVTLALTLRGLDVDATRRLASHLTSGDVAPELANALAEVSGGNPFFARELVSHLANAGRMIPTDQGFSLPMLDPLISPMTAADHPHLGIPDTVREVVIARYGGLSQSAGTLLRAIAIFPSGATVDVLRELTNLDELSLLDALDEALAARLIVPVAGTLETYAFAHAIAAEAIADELNPSRRVRLHRRAAHMLERHYGDRSHAHAAELTYHFLRSASLPGAERGIPYALAASHIARDSGGRDQAVAAARAALTLAESASVDQRVLILCQLTVAEADAYRHEEAETTAREALDALNDAIARGSITTTDAAEHLQAMIAALRNAYAHRRIWAPLRQRALELAEPNTLNWARLALLIEPIALCSPAPVRLPGLDPPPVLRAGRWLGYQPRAVQITRSLGTDEDAARSFESFDARTITETWNLVRTARGWRPSTATLRGLTIAANDLMYRHGDFGAAADLWNDIIERCERLGFISWQAQACKQLSFLAVAAGNFDTARDLTNVARALLERLGPFRESDIQVLEMRTSLALYHDGEWPRLASAWDRELLAPPTTTAESQRSDEHDAMSLSLLSGPVFGGLATVAHARAGSRDAALAYVEALVDVLSQDDLTATNQNQNGAVAFAAEALWLANSSALPKANNVPSNALQTLARRLRDSADQLVAAGIGDYPQTSLVLSLARLSVILNDYARATIHFRDARDTLRAADQRPLWAIATHDATRHLVSHHPHVSPQELATWADPFTEAIATFSELGMHTWSERAAALRTDFIERLQTLSANQTISHPAGLTDREVDVVRLVARGLTDREIADSLFISPRTVHAHLRNVLAKTEAINRTELSVWAVQHGLMPSGEP